MRVRDLLAALDGVDPSVEVEFIVDQPYSCCPEEGSDDDWHEHEIDEVPVDHEPIVTVLPMSSVRVVLPIGKRREPPPPLPRVIVINDMAYCGGLSMRVGFPQVGAHGAID